MKINKVSLGSDSYPQILEQLAFPPTPLYYLGTLPKIHRPSVAMIGTRKPTVYGKEVTFELAYNLAKRGVIIISGLAYGIDAIAHRAAIQAGGTTIAVLANGLDTVYPASHARLAQEIITSGGAIISEYPPGIKARNYQFLARNRIVSGLADAVVVTEAAARSGTLSTANHALDQNKEVFAVPGNITSLLSIGPNQLLQQGAHPALSAVDILNTIAPQLTETQTSLPLNLTANESTILSLISSGIREGDTIQRQSGLSHGDYAQAVTMLEIAGTIRRTTDSTWTVV